MSNPQPSGDRAASGGAGPAPADPSEPGRPDTPYQSLYRRYRPRRFSEVRGQDHVTRALRNAVRDGRVTHAYLFSGPRGTGKTSTARILAKALNCLAPLEGEPCSVCDSCLSIAAGSSFDVHELDAASNNGVEAMRDLVARAALATPGRYKVYIVDEVHMLSTAASNALLKTLEEPPEHVAFVLATTDPQKVLPTIRSRSQHYEFHLLGDEVLEGLLEDVAGAAGLELPGGALDLARRRAKGSARDALSVLDRVAAGGVLDDDSDEVEQIVVALAGRDLPGVLLGLDRALTAGRDAQQVAVEIVERLRAGFLALVAPGAGDGARARAIEGIGMAGIVQAMEAVGGAIVSMRDAPEPRITLEVALARCAGPGLDGSTVALLERLERLERAVAGLGAAERAEDRPERARAGAPAPAVPPAGPSRPTGGAEGASRRPSPKAAVAAVEPAPGATPGAARPSLGAFRRGPSPAAPEPAAPPPATAAPEPPAASRTAAVESDGPPTRDELVEAWGDRVLPGLRPRVKALFGGGRFLSRDGAEVVFAFPNAAHLEHAEPHRLEVADALSSHFGRPVTLRLVAEAEPGEASTNASRAATGRARRAGGGPPGEREGVHDAPVSEVPGEDPDEAELLASLAGDDEGEDGGDARREAPSGRAANLAGLSWAEERLLKAFPGAKEV